MATQIRAYAQIKNGSVTKELLDVDLLRGGDLDLTGGNKNATIKGLKDAVLDDSPVTLGQFNTFKNQVTGSLKPKGNFDASNLGTQLDNAKAGSYYVVTVAGVIFATNPIELAVGDHLVVANDVVGTPTNGNNFFKVDNTESLDILRLASIEDSLTSTSATRVLSAKQGKALKDQIDSFVSSQKIPVYGEELVPTAGSAVLPPLINAPINGSVRVYLNGLRVKLGAGNDYQINYVTKVITFEYALKADDAILVDYDR